MSCVVVVAFVAGMIVGCLLLLGALALVAVLPRGDGFDEVSWGDDHAGGVSGHD